MANILTVLRIIGMFPLFYIIINHGPTNVSFILFTILGLTDSLDGYIARKYNQVTNFGKIADGIADKLFMLGTTIALLTSKVIPYWTLIIFIREIIAVIYAGFHITKNKVIIKPSIYGKIKTTFHMVSIGLVLLIGKWNIYSAVILVIAILLFFPEFISRLRYTKNRI